jgi:hypothetical protein
MMIWRLLASVLVVVSDQGRRQRQPMKHVLFAPNEKLTVVPLAALQRVSATAIFGTAAARRKV